MGLYTVLKKLLLPGEPPLLCPCYHRHHHTCVPFQFTFYQRCCIILAQTEPRRARGRLQMDPLLYQIIQPMKYKGEMQPQAGSLGDVPWAAGEPCASQGVKYFLWT